MTDTILWLVVIIVTAIFEGVTTALVSNKVSVKLSDGKIKEFPNNEVEMIDTDVNIEIDINTSNYKYASMQQTDENIDIKQFEDDKNSSTGNI